MTAEAKGPLPPPSTAQASILQTDPSDPITVVEDHVAVPEAAQQEDVAYTIYKPWQKRLIVAGTAVCCFYNPLSAQMYMPALNQLAEDFDVTPAQINLTVTTYLIFQGLTPLLVSGFSDALGRRPGYVAGFVVFLSANISLALAHEYTQMLIVRCLQSAGSSIIMVLCQAAVADIVTPAERGQYVSITAIPIILGPSLGPVIGGALTQYLGWRSIFWFLTIGSTINFILLLCLLPETCRNVVGDGSIRPPVIYRTLLQTITYSRKSSESESPPNLDSLGTSATSPRAPPAEKLPISKFVARTLLSSALLFTNPELVLLLCCGGIVFSGVYAIGTAAPNLFATLYQFNDLEVGLVYLPMAAGSILAVLVVGPTMNWNYRRHAKKLGLSVERNRTTDLSHFPIEKARLQIGLPLLLLGVAVMCCWGWIMANQADIEEVCALVFVTGICLAGVNNTIQALIIDIYPEKPGAVLAAYNLTKCMFGAVASAVIDPMIRAMGLGPAFTLLGALCLGFAPIIVIIMWKGIAWRKYERERKERRLAKKASRRQRGEEESVGDKTLGPDAPQPSAAGIRNGYTIASTVVIQLGAFKVGNQTGVVKNTCT